MKIFIFHAAAGHGHKKVAEVIAKAFKERGIPAADLHVEDALDRTPVWFRKSYPAIYFNSVKYTPQSWGWSYETLDLPAAYKMIHPLRTHGNRLVGNKLLQWVEKEKPDVIITTHFYSAELFARAKREGRINSLLITVITDFYPHSFWVNEGTDVYWGMADETKDELIKRGVPAEKIQAMGIPVDSIFKPSGRRAEILAKFGFEKNRLTLLLTSGSFGLGPQKEILRELAAFKDRVQCFTVCGNNNDLKKTLEAEKYEFPVKVFGFVDFMADLMEASDLIVAKPGGATTTESLAKELPMVVMDPIPGQEMRNARLLKERNAAFFLEKPEQIKPIIKTILEQPEILNAKRREILRLAKPYAADDLVSFVLKGAGHDKG